eukprot:gb/GEZN01002166.1/.p1 GENE.gb/GEZN01002166.1/~~gb/GEZN01002166.1/.p1  ORF type:complete len:737 (+),score=103.58 gb/GEZN01002166.1/:216-2213(+)
MVNRASCYLHLDRLDEALEDCESALRLHPRYATGHLRKGQVLMKMGKMTEAKVCFEVSLELNQVRQQQIDVYGAEKVAATSSSTPVTNDKENESSNQEGGAAAIALPGGKKLKQFKEARASEKALKQINNLKAERTQGLLSTKIHSEYEVDTPPGSPDKDPSKHPFASAVVDNDNREDAYEPPAIPEPRPLPAREHHHPEEPSDGNGKSGQNAWERAAALASLSFKNDSSPCKPGRAARSLQGALSPSSDFASPPPSHDIPSPGESPAYPSSGSSQPQSRSHLPFPSDPYNPATTNFHMPQPNPPAASFRSPSYAPDYGSPPPTLPSFGSPPHPKSGWVMGGLKSVMRTTGLVSPHSSTNHAPTSSDFENASFAGENAAPVRVARPTLSSITGSSKPRGAPFEVLVDSFARNQPALDSRINAMLKRGTVVYVTNVRSDGWALHDKGYTVCNDVHGQILWDRSRRLAAKSRDTCKACHSRLLNPSTTTASSMLWRPASTLIARAIPPQVCRSCGEAFCGSCCNSKNVLKIPYCPPCKAGALNRLATVSLLNRDQFPANASQRVTIPFVKLNPLMAARMAQAAVGQAGPTDGQSAPWSASSSPSTSSASAMVPPVPRSQQYPSHYPPTQAAKPAQGSGGVTWHSPASMFATQQRVGGDSQRVTFHAR